MSTRLYRTRLSDFIGIGPDFSREQERLDPGGETGWFDDHGQSCPWPEDPENWFLEEYEPEPLKPGEQPF